MAALALHVGSGLGAPRSRRGRDDCTRPGTRLGGRGPAMSERYLAPKSLRTAEEVAALLAVPVSWVREHTRAGTIPCVELGRYKRYDEDEVRAWVETCRKGGRPTSFRGYTPATENRAPAPRKRPGA